MYQTEMVSKNSWIAWHSDDEFSGPYGKGPTEAEAIDDLQEKIDCPGGDDE